MSTDTLTLSQPGAVAEPAAATGIHHLPRPTEVSRMSVEEVYAAFVLADLVRPGHVSLRFTDLDRLVVGVATPTVTELALPDPPETGTARLLERREMGVLNIGGPGAVTIDGQRHGMSELDGCYVGKGVGTVHFASDDAACPAMFYLLSCPAHEAMESALIRRDDARTLELGTAPEANQRVIRQYIHPHGQRSCQLVMGFTALKEGNVWNTFPPHTHHRRTEVYFYFNMGKRVVAHFLGEPHATRHVFLHENHAVLSPSWSIHSGCGQGAYSFIWGMAGENQVFSDMDGVPVRELR